MLGDWRISSIQTDFDMDKGFFIYFKFQKNIPSVSIVKSIRLSMPDYTTMETLPLALKTLGEEAVETIQLLDDYLND